MIFLIFCSWGFNLWCPGEGHCPCEYLLWPKSLLGWDQTCLLADKSWCRIWSRSEADDGWDLGGHGQVFSGLFSFMIHFFRQAGLESSLGSPSSHWWSWSTVYCLESNRTWIETNTIEIVLHMYMFHFKKTTLCLFVGTLLCLNSTHAKAD